MMKFYTKPEIEALALDVVDVIETSSAVEGAQAALESQLPAGPNGEKADVKVINEQIAEMSTDWQW